MAEKTTKKQAVALTVTRKRPFPVQVVMATGFSLRYDKYLGLIDVKFEASGQAAERVLLDPTIIQDNLGIFKSYVARMPGEQNDAALKEEIMVGPGRLANIVHFCHMGLRAETIFGLICLSEWLESGRKGATQGAATVESNDVLVVYSTREFQKKMLLEMIIVLSQHANV